MGLNLYKDYYLSKSLKYNLTHPLRWVKSGLANLRFARQRRKRGFADIDWWNMDSWFLEIIPNMLDHLADNSCSYPGRDEFDTPEKWRTYLHNLASDFRLCTEDAADKMNEYYSDFLESIEKIHIIKKEKDGNSVVTWDEDEEDKKLSKKYFDRCKEIQEEQDTIREEAMRRLAEILPSLWD